MGGKLTKREREAGAVRDATLENLLAAARPWDIDAVKEVAVTVAMLHGEVSANDVRDLLPERLHPLIGPAFNSLTHQRGPLVNTGRRVPSTSPATKGHGISVYRWAAPSTAEGEAA
ncbi:hypothetical protein [Streptomyces sp. SP17KL33]|uniref:hypothetical protein n=1 Tax=Streptomyces sp. SP17KL33 TaxID=3002534 RepID=UPI002E779EC3|nr:hypothetical protein [Streptomyces sp. SP17KL33]MEE1838124.1 hypothetical protein [Streptomyces sp. SP17KL33]